MKKLLPCLRVKNVAEIDLEQLWNVGKRGIICDIDNTLCRDGKFEIEPPSETFVKKALLLGFKICLMSNNGKERVEPVAEHLNLPFIYKAHKPSAQAYLRCLEKMNTRAENSIMVGDQLFTDIYGANRLSIFSILVDRIDKAEIFQIKLKRPFEKILLFFYKNR